MITTTSSEHLRNNEHESEGSSLSDTEFEAIQEREVSRARQAQEAEELYDAAPVHRPSLALPSHIMSMVAEPLPPLHTPHRRRITKLTIGLLLCTLDLCALPITYYYALKFGTNLSLQDSMLLCGLPQTIWLIGA